jgi:DNA-binding LacI/PurR family transcriptional regulator
LLLARESDDGRDLAGSASVDGFVLANMSPHDERPARLAAHDIPFACFGRVDPGLPQSWIDVDNTAALRTVTEHLVRAGHRAVTFVGYDTGSYWDREREAGYAATMAEAGLPATVVRTGNDAAAATTRIESLLDGADRPSAVVTGSDALAGAVYAVAARRGLAIGGDLAVTGFDGGILSRMLSPTLTTVVIPVHAIAERLVDRVLRQVDGEDPGQGEVVTLELRLGGSA